MLPAASAFLLLTHFVSSTPVRPAVVSRVGEGPWLGLYSLVSFVAFGWLIWAYAQAETVWLYAPPAWAWPVTWVFVPLGFAFIVASTTTPNPALTLMDGLLDREDAVQGVLCITRHPMLWGFALFSVAHMLVNPDVASWWLFGTIAVLSLAGTVLQDVKKARDVPAWPAYAAATSNVPFLAILQGRQRFPAEGRLFAQALGGLVAAVAAGAMHPWWVGVGVGL